MNTNYEDVKATVYVKSDKTLIAIGNFDNIERNVRLDIDWDILGIDLRNVTLTTPEIKKLQKARNYTIKEGIPIKPKEGKLLILQRKQPVKKFNFI